jgi:RNA polymerase III subunit RPC82
VSELLQSGNQTASQNIKGSAADSDNKDVKAALQLQEQCKKFTSLVKAEYLICGPVAKEDLQEANTPTCCDDKILMVNFERFHQDFRNILMISPIEQKLGNVLASVSNSWLERMYVKSMSW